MVLKIIWVRVERNAGEERARENEEECAENEPSVHTDTWANLYSFKNRGAGLQLSFWGQIKSQKVWVLYLFLSRKLAGFKACRTGSDRFESGS